MPPPTTPPTPQKHLLLLDCGLSTPTPSPPHGRILSCTPQGTNLHTLLPNLTHHPDGITLDRTKNHIYMTLMGSTLGSNSGSIVRANLDGSGMQTVIPSGNIGVWTPKQIVFVRDEQGKGWIYWCDREGMKVARACVDGGSAEVEVEVEVLIDAGEAGTSDLADKRRWCVGIAVDITQGYIYWSQKGGSKANEGRILRARIEDPEATREVLFDGLPEPIDLELVVRRGGGGRGMEEGAVEGPKEGMMEEEEEEEEEGVETVLYWTDRGDPPRGNSLNRAVLGRHPRPHTASAVQVLATRFHEAIGLAVDEGEGKVYVSDLAGGVYEVDLTTGGKKVLFQEVGDLTGLVVV